MTDAHLPDRWLLDARFAKISDAAWRVYTYGLMYGVQQGTDGHIPAHAVRFLHPLGVTAEVIDELVGAKLWNRLPDDEFLSTNWTPDQSSAAYVAQTRANAAARQRKSRAAKKKPPDEKSSHATSHATSPVTDLVSTGQSSSSTGSEESEATVSTESRSGAGYVSPYAESDKREREAAMARIGQQRRGAAA